MQLCLSAILTSVCPLMKIFAVVLKMLEFYKVFIIPVSCMVYTDDYNTLSARNTDVFKEFIAYAHTVSLENKYIRRIIFNHYKYSLARRRRMKDDDGYCYLKMNFDTLFSFGTRLFCRSLRSAILSYEN